MSRILIAEDDRLQGAAMRACLIDGGHEVRVVGDGDELLDRYAQASADVIVLDHRMPRRSGLEVLQVIRAARMRAAIPVMMVTAENDPRFTLEILRAGADDFLAKPFSPHEFARRIAALLVRHPCQRSLIA
ncbi:response regulator transcription factor [Alteriqipengyuania flavescens]|uniref:response regulator transcription factor n=1 Tax=Alteriqipengyuania flavescens TaxID=3053610 RepID=UPI0025B5797A|nr:response regulator transcription factor [Alteriqipengyuania flavescens]WJY19229.1 response regulator transcription factor [Alteriqipengyuania flavescens]WJY25170.1 response regulator transcription factor [Alteriqipengyuania flavescens]